MIWSLQVCIYISVCILTVTDSFIAQAMKDLVLSQQVEEGESRIQAHPSL